MNWTNHMLIHGLWGSGVLLLVLAVGLAYLAEATRRKVVHLWHKYK
jgi:hypothetical protein